MSRMEVVGSNEKMVLVERIGDHMIINCPVRFIRLTLYPIQRDIIGHSNILFINEGFYIRGSLCGAPTEGMIIRQREPQIPAAFYFGFLHPSKIINERRRVIIPVPPMPRRTFYGFIESFAPFKRREQTAHNANPSTISRS